jgi:malonate-semialdehyde dehydrogenase (acetylating)/methylmalonate-semialdehyde dehydrogenase
MYGDQNSYGKAAVKFFTRTKTMTTRWFEPDHQAGAVNTTITLK